MSQHRWCGWPGAWCLDCGVEDQNEICLAVHNRSLECTHGHWVCDQHPSLGCDEHVNGPCPCPGAGLADPYSGLPAARADLVALLTWRLAVLAAAETGAFL